MDTRKPLLTGFLLLLLLCRRSTELSTDILCEAKGACWSTPLVHESYLFYSAVMHLDTQMHPELTCRRLSSSSFFLACSCSRSSAFLGFLTVGLCFFRRHDCTYFSSSLKVDGLRVSKSISISSGLESRRPGSLDWIMWTTLPSLSPESRWSNREGLETFFLCGLELVQ